MPWSAAIAVGGSLLGGYISSKGAKDAAATSAAGTEAGIAEQRRQFDTIRGDTQPYRDVGASSLYQLSNIYGLTPPGGYPAPNYGSAASGGGGSVSAPGGGWATSIDPKLISNLNIDPNFQNYALGPIVQPSADYRTPESGGQFARGGNQYFAGGPGGFNERTGQNPLGRYIPLQQGADGTYSPGNPPQSPRSPADIIKSYPGYQFRLDEANKALERYSSKYRGSPRAQKEIGRYISDYSSNEFNKYLEGVFRLSGLGGAALNTSANAGIATGQGISNAIQTGAVNSANAGIAGAAGINNAIQGGISNYLTLQNYNRQPTPTPFYGVGAYPY